MKTKLPIIHIILLLFLTASMVFLFYRAKLAVENVAKLQLEVSRQDANISKLLELSELMPRLSEETNTYLKTLPATEVEVSDFVSLVERMAKGLNLTVSFHFDDFPISTDVGGKNAYGLNMEISLDGSYQNLTSFLARLSGLPYFFKIDKMTMLKNEKAPGLKMMVNGSLVMNLEKK